MYSTCYDKGKFLQLLLLFFTACDSFLNTKNLCGTMFQAVLGILDCNFLQLFYFLHATFYYNFY